MRLKYHNNHNKFCILSRMKVLLKREIKKLQIWLIHFLYLHSSSTIINLSFHRRATYIHTRVHTTHINCTIRYWERKKIPAIWMSLFAQYRVSPAIGEGRGEERGGEKFNFRYSACWYCSVCSGVGYENV